jgi:hypothetical protein
MSQFQPGSSPNPFSPAPGAYQQPKKSNTWLWVLLGVGGIFAVVCCGCGGVGYMLMQTGFTVIEQDLQNRLAGDPTVQEHIGNVQSVELDFIASVQESEKRGGDQVFRFHVTGDKGNADVVGGQPPQGGTTVSNPILILPSGEEIPL